jgi:hypothetical protein
MQKSIYDFATLEDVIVYFNDKRGIQPIDIEIGGAFGGPNPTEDDDPVFTWH